MKEKEALIAARNFKLHDESARGTVGCASVRACRVSASKTQDRTRDREDPRCARDAEETVGFHGGEIRKWRVGSARSSPLGTR